MSGRRLREHHPGWRVYQRLVANSPGCRAPLFGLLILSTVAAPLALLVPLPLKIVLDNVIGDEPADFLAGLVPGAGAPSKNAMLVVAVLLVVVVAVLVEVVFLVGEVLGVWVGERLRLDLRTRLFHRAQRLSLAYHDTVGTADSLCRIEKDATSVKFIPTSGITPVVTAVLTLAGMCVVTVRIDAQLSLVALLVAPLLYLATRASARRLRTMWTDAMALESSALAVVSEVLGSLRVVKAFGGENREQERFLSWSGKSAHAHVRIAVLDRGFSVLVGLILGLGSASALLIGTDHVLAGRISAGDLVLVMAYIAMLYAPLKTIATTVGNLQMAFAAAERAFDLLDAPPEVTERPDTRPLGRAEGNLEFQKVSFSYPEGGARPAERLLRGADRLASRHSGSHRCRQDNAGQPAHQVLRPCGGAHPPGRRRPAGLPTRGSAAPIRHRAPGIRALLDQHRREHRLRQTGGERGGDHRCGTRGRCTRFHLAPPGRLRHRRRGAGGHAVRW